MLMLDAGYASVHDSYLTPITYDGVDLALSVEAVRHVRQGQWLWQLNVGADYNFVENPSKNTDLHSKRQVYSYITKEDVAKKLFDEISPKYADRKGGYTQIVKIGPRRGDAAEAPAVPPRPGGGARQRRSRRPARFPSAGGGSPRR